MWYRKKDELSAVYVAETLKMNVLNPTVTNLSCYQGSVVNYAQMDLMVSYLPAISSFDVMEDDDRNSNEFAALLTGIGMDPPVATSYTGHARFTFSKKNLHYSIYLGRHEQLAHVRFVDSSGRILEEVEADPDVVRAKSYKICGEWRKIPKIYRKLLRDEKIHLELAQTKEADALIKGAVIRYRSLSTETFSALLRPPDGAPQLDGAGGMVIISSMSTTASIVHFLITFNGIVSDYDIAGLPMVFKAISEEKTPNVILEETVKLAKPNNSLSVLEWKIELSPKELRYLLMGSTLLSLAPKFKPDMSLSGRIMPKLTCNSFQAVLSSGNSFEEEKPFTQAAGYATITLNDDNTIAYSVYVTGLSSKLLALTLEAHQKKKLHVVENLISTFNNSWANGTFSRRTPREMEMLLAGEFSLNLATEKYESEARGTINQRLYTEAHSVSAPVLLTGPHTSAVGLAWIHVDAACKLSYDFVLSGLENERGMVHNYLVELVESAQNNDGERRLLQTTTATESEDVVDEIGRGTLSRVDSKVTFFQVNQSGEHLVVRGRINNVHVPLACLPQYEQFGDYTHETNHITEETYKCFYEGKFFEDGSQWTSQHDSCMMCSCRRDRVSCDPVICPKPQCNDIVQLIGECCPSCPSAVNSDNSMDNKENASKGCYFDGDKKWHQAGTIWHPYLPPFGFSKCAVCTCDAYTLTVECQRTTCPPLPCDERHAIRAEPEACCKICPVTTPPSIFQTKDVMKDEGSAKNVSDFLSEGGCIRRDQVFANGQEWHPRLAPFGEEKCIRCNCKDGKIICKRQKCPALHCENRVELADQCCPKCAGISSFISDGSTSIKYRHKGSGRHKGKQ
uniref:VWFC domain-containing protein n=1 Tax=Strigamia maritima TaxID=126957 RepID=T1JBK0_STRMM